MHKPDDPKQCKIIFNRRKRRRQPKQKPKKTVQPPTPNPPAYSTPPVIRHAPQPRKRSRLDAPRRLNQATRASSFAGPQDNIPLIDWTTDRYLATLFRRGVVRLSRSTSYNTNDCPIQSDPSAPRTFHYGAKLASAQPHNAALRAVDRKAQRMSAAIAAFCYSCLRHPNKWTQGNIDAVLVAGNELFLECAATKYLLGEADHRVADRRKYCRFGDNHVRFVISEPKITGTIRSSDRRTHDLAKATHAFFQRHSAAILETETLSVAMWKDRQFYFFDAGPRTVDLYSRPEGRALIATFDDATSIVSVLLDRSDLGNQPFAMYAIEAHKVLPCDVENADSGVILEVDTFADMHEAKKAVVRGSFDVTDDRFAISRRKQAFAVAAVALVYAKIAPASRWRRETIDGILTTGDRVFREYGGKQSSIADLPAVIVVGPFLVEIQVAPQRFVEVGKSGRRMGEELEGLFKGESGAIVGIDDSAIAVWKQDCVFCCLDPYSRDEEGFKCRDGAACVSMHTTLKSLVRMIKKNWKWKDGVLRMQVLRVCKVRRDPKSTGLFVRPMTMLEYLSASSNK